MYTNDLKIQQKAILRIIMSCLKRVLDPVKHIMGPEVKKRIIKYTMMLI